MGYVELKPMTAKVGPQPASSPMPASTETTANASKEIGDIEPEIAKSGTNVDSSAAVPTVTQKPESSSKGNSLSAKAPPFVPSTANTTGASLPPSSRSFAQNSTRTATDGPSRGGQTNLGASAVKGDVVTNSTKATNTDSEV